MAKRNCIHCDHFDHFSGDLYADESPRMVCDKKVWVFEFDLLHYLRDTILIGETCKKFTPYPGDDKHLCHAYW